MCEREREEKREIRYIVGKTELERHTDREIETSMKRGREREGEGEREREREGDEIHRCEDRE